jgi:hypothetical protein
MDALSMIILIAGQDAGRVRTLQLTQASCHLLTSQLLARLGTRPSIGMPSTSFWPGHRACLHERPAESVADVVLHRRMSFKPSLLHSKALQKLKHTSERSQERIPNKEWYDTKLRKFLCRS